MRTRWLRLALVAAVAAFLHAGLATAPARAAEDYDPSTILVKFSIPSQAQAIFRAFGDQASARLADDVFVVRVPSGRSVPAALAIYARLFGVAYAEPNYIATATLASPNDASASSQWSLGKISAVSGWSRLFGVYPASLDGPLIAVIDTGVQANHPDLNGHVVIGGNCLSGTCSNGGSADDNDHGTHVSGIAAASTNNATGIAGIALTSPILPVKVLDAGGSGTYAAIAAGIDYAVSRGAQVINMSLAGSAYSSTLCSAVSRAVTANVVVVAAAGNSGSSSPAYPAACPGSIGVAATTSTDVYASYSNYGSSNVFVAAPGSSIYSTIAGSSYATYNGTSMAAPHVAALAALLRAQTPGLSIAGVKTVLATTSDKVGSGYGTDPFGTCSGCTWSSRYGYGRINLDRALGAGASQPPPPPPPVLDTERPNAPSPLTANVSGTTITLSWPVPFDNVGVTGYEVERCQGTSCSSFAQIATPTSAGLVDGGLASSTSYSYRVRAKDAAGNLSLYSDTASQTTAGSPPPPPPTSLTTAFPTAVTVLTGTATAGNAASLGSVDQSYYTVRAPILSSATWYGTFAADAGASDFKVTFTGFASRSCTLSLAMYRWSTATWVTVGTSRSLGTSQVTVADQAPDSSVPASEFRNGSGQVRVRVACSAFTFSKYTSSTNLLQLSYRS